ncbi:MAG: DUF4856 domain-containing protein [Deltaproteobacteria bacterium]|nr:MAG: DUF4856 domain-containing protein [Deltaproteobacteria bacterium]
MPRLLPLLTLLACNGPGGDDTTDATTYAFERGGESSVSYSGQTFRHVLIDDMKGHIGGLTDRLNGGSFFPTEGEVAGELEFYLGFDSSVAGSLEVGFSADLPLDQSVYDDISSDKNLREKLAGNDTVTDHVDWQTAFVGWPGAESPEALVDLWVDTLDAQAVGWNSAPPLDPDGAPVSAVYVTAEGQDLQQLLQKFLLGAVAFSQGADDYLDDDVDGKGLLADHSAPAEGKAYTELEHAWDEGFGYFGASASYGEWTKDEIAAGVKDADDSGSIDLGSEVCWGASANAAKRDLGAVSATTFTEDAWAGFHGGRALLASIDGDLDEAQLDELRGYRDQAVLAWESAIAATIVHYINEVIVDTEAIGTGDYDFAGHAKHWSEMKGFALSLQFSPHSPLSDDDFAAVMDKMGTAPALDGDDLTAYATALREARGLIGEAYGFDAANLGDEHGQNGW